MKKYIPYIAIAVLLASLFVSLTNRREVVIEKITSDTVYITKIDTFKALQPIFINETIVDTIYIENNAENGLKLPLTQKYYSEPNKYDVWVSGYRPNLDSIQVYNKTEYLTITNTTTKEIYPKTTDFYFNIGTNYMSDKFVPNLGLMVKFKKGFIFGGDIGMYDNKVMYGFRLGFKISK